MSNPFSGSKPPVRRSRDLIGRQSEAKKLESFLINRMNAVIMGPEGIGKSSFLNCFFDRSLRLRMAQDSHLLIVRIIFPIHLRGEEVYHYLADAIESSLSILQTADPENAEQLIQLVASMRSFKLGSSRLQEICKVIDEFEYDITLVIDDFENFTSSKSIQMEHHGIMRDLIKKHYANYVVATNYDFNQDSLPQAVSGSFLLMEFSGNEIHLNGFSQNMCREYLESQGANGCFSDRDYLMLAQISGGIPALLRLAAEIVWEKKQVSPVLSDDDWCEVMEQLCQNSRIKWYMNQWCRVLTEKQVAVIDRILEESNTMGIITDQSLTSAAKSLLNRGLLIPRYHNGQILEDCYTFNSDLLEGYCYETVLHVSDPHDVQKYSIAKQLKEMIESGEQTEVLKLLQDICSLMDNVSMPFDYEEPLTNEILQQFELNEELLNSFDPFVQKQIISGIRIERTFMRVSLQDYSPVYISFAKAVEAHMNKMVVPILKRVTPNHVLSGNRVLRNTTDSLMLGEIYIILSSYRDGLQSAVYKEAAQYCQRQGCKDFDEQWWNRLKQDLYYVKDIRNDMPHITPLSSKSGVDLLRLLFQGESSFTYRCTCLHNAMEQAEREGPANSLRVGAVLTGIVKSVSRSAAYVDIGADRDGYLHISEVKYGRVNDMFQEFQRGQQIRVKILSIDADRGEYKLTKKDVPQK